MAKITIEVNNTLVANALADMCEGGELAEAVNEYLDGLGSPVEMDQFADVQFDESEYNPHHEATFS